jgi:hypothetical protein
MSFHIFFRFRKKLEMDNSDKQEFTDDLLISCKMGKRSYANRKPKDTESQDLPHEEPESDA